MGAAVSELPGPLSGRFSEDHHDLDARWELFLAEERAGAGRPRERFAEFRDDLLRHIRAEEEILFPRLLLADPSGPPLVRQLLEEHDRIRGALGKVEEAIDRGPDDVEVAGESFVEELWAHNAREEGIAYPMMDRLLPDDVRTAAMERLTERPPSG
jgi:hemerythrin superfamily protein